MSKKRRLNWSRVALVFLIFIFLILFILFFRKLIIKSKINNNENLFSQEKIIENKNEQKNLLNNNTEEVILNEKEENKSFIISNNNQKNNEKNLEDISININVAGDIITHNSNFKDAHNVKDDTYDFSYVFDNIAGYFENADFNIGTLESNFAGKAVGYSNYPQFNAPEDLAYDLKELGFDVLATAHNHALDKGYNGLVNTLNELDAAGIDHLGSYSSEEDSKEFLIKDVKGIKLGILDYDYDTNGIPIPKGKEYCINLIDSQKIVDDLANIKKLDPDVIIVVMHWGTEYRTTATQEQKDLAELMFANGADIILGSHPHVLEPMEMYDIKLDDGAEKKGFVIYSLGNFTSGQYQENTRQTALLDIKLTKHGETGKVTIDYVHYTPLFMLNYFSGGEGAHNFRLLDIEAEIERYESGNHVIGQELYNTLKKEVVHIYKVLGDEIDN